MKILLACSAGMSTSLLEKSMNDYAQSNNIDVQTVAMSTISAKGVISEYDIIFLGPQVRYELASFKKICGNKPVDIVPQALYAMGKGKEVVELAQKILKGN